MYKVGDKVVTEKTHRCTLFKIPAGETVTIVNVHDFYGYSIEDKRGIIITDCGFDI